MSATPILYFHDDVGAPPLDDTAGSLANLLAAILCNGYGAKAPAGWSETLGGDDRAFTSQSGFVLEVQDGQAGIAYKEAKIYGYSSHVSLGVGADQTPVLYSRKSALGPQIWMAIACRRFIYLFVDHAGLGRLRDASLTLIAAELKSLTPADGFAFLVAGNDAADVSSGSGSRLFSQAFSLFQAPAPGPGAAAFVLRSATGAPGVLPCHLLHPFGSVGAASAFVGGDGVPFPHPSGDIVLSTALVMDGVASARGYLPHVYWPWHYKPYTDLQTNAITIPGVTLTAKSFVEGGTYGQALFDTTSAY